MAAKILAWMSSKNFAKVFGDEVAANLKTVFSLVKIYVSILQENIHK